MAAYRIVTEWCSNCHPDGNEATLTFIPISLLQLLILYSLCILLHYDPFSFLNYFVVTHMILWEEPP